MWPNWLIAPSTGHTNAASAKGRAPGLEGTGEEVVEAGVLRDVGLGCLVHVDLVLAHKPLDEGVCPFATTRSRHSACKLREQLFGHHILGENK